MSLLTHRVPECVDRRALLCIRSIDPAGSRLDVQGVFGVLVCTCHRFDVQGVFVIECLCVDCVYLLCRNGCRWCSRSCTFRLITLGVLLIYQEMAFALVSKSTGSHLTIAT